MTQQRDTKSLERLSTLDVVLPQLWARRGLTRLAKFGRRFTGLFGRGGVATESPALFGYPTTIGGLEVGLSSGAILVTPGQLLVDLAAGINGAIGSVVTRPNTYTFQDPQPGVTPAKPEADDDEVAIYDSAYVRDITPVFGAALAAAEWWVIYTTPATSTVETEIGRLVFNQTTGGWDATSTAKVSKNLLTFGVARGTASSGLPAIPSDSFPLAALHVPSGATNLTGATMLFDMRQLHEPSMEPNKIGGAWVIRKVSTIPCFQGSVWAHHLGEHMEFRAGIPLPIDNICSPGATWDAAASPTAPKIAWLYLARAGNGRVPRLKQQAGAALTTNATTLHNWYGQGVLVLSPVPPRLGLGTAKNETAGRWDMQSSAAIPLPSYENTLGTPALRYPFSGQTCGTGGAICVGMLVYDGVSGGVPSVLDVDVDAQGWMRGAAIRAQSAEFEATNPIAFAVDGSASGTVVVNVTKGQVGSFVVPVDGVEALFKGSYIDQAVAWSDGSGTSNDDAVNGSILTDRFRASIPLPSILTYSVASGVIAGVGTPAGPGSMVITGARMPYGEPLFT